MHKIIKYFAVFLKRLTSFSITAFTLLLNQIKPCQTCQLSIHQSLLGSPSLSLLCHQFDSWWNFVDWYIYKLFRYTLCILKLHSLLKVLQQGNAKKTHKTVIDDYCSSIEVKSKKLIDFNIKDNIHSEKQKDLM